VGPVPPAKHNVFTVILFFEYWCWFVLVSSLTYSCRTASSFVYPVPFPTSAPPFIGTTSFATVPLSPLATHSASRTSHSFFRTGNSQSLVLFLCLLCYSVSWRTPASPPFPKPPASFFVSFSFSARRSSGALPLKIPNLIYTLYCRHFVLSVSLFSSNLFLRYKMCCCSCG